MGNRSQLAAYRVKLQNQVFSIKLILRLFTFKSIQIRIMAATTLLIVAIVTVVVWVWTRSESSLYYQQKLNAARSFSLALSESWTSKLVEGDWSLLRLGFEILMQENEDLLYILVSDTRLKDRIVAASPSELAEQYFPDIVPVRATETALLSSNKPRSIETFILRDIEFPKGKIRARRGDRIIEVASDMRSGSGEKIGTFRLGMSLRQVDEAVANAVNQALLVGAIGLAIGSFGAYILARQLSKPIERLQISAAKIAAGDLQHRARVDRQDEIGTLAASFNEMSAALQESFGKLQKTLESFERFVPEKFISVIALDGIENIQVGVASKRTITILFCDIRGYTAMSEQMTPLETFYFLNDYLAYMGQAIDKSGGFIDKYIGDAIMALFDHPTTDCALNAAIGMRQALVAFNQQRVQQGHPTIDVGIGIHRGEVVMGTVGFTSRIDSTVIGDAVNLASRLEGLTKTYGCPILVTESVVAALHHPQAFGLRLVDRMVKVKGKEEAIAIYELQL